MGRCKSECKFDGDDSRKAAGQQNRPLPGASSIRGRVRHDVDVIQKVVLVLVLYVRLRESVVHSDSLHHSTETACRVDESQDSEVLTSVRRQALAGGKLNPGGRRRVRAHSGANLLMGAYAYAVTRSGLDTHRFSPSSPHSLLLLAPPPIVFITFARRVSSTE